ncbi:MAG: transposase [Candidatus Eremiobacteraeota bacterium]|nr:transposase [Candidatus Eremiobacteraeota bacterium]
MHKVRLYPTPTQERALDHALHLTRNLYNAALDQRRYEYRAHGRAVSAKMQYAELTALRADSTVDAGVYRELQDAVLHRLDLGMSAFFRRFKRGETPGFPRFKNDARWNQLEFPHGNRAVKLDSTQGKIRVPNVGVVRLRKGREVPLNYGRAFLIRKNARWYAVFECKREIEPMRATGKVIGIDAGITALLATSEGELVDNPRHFARNRANIELAAIALDAVTRKDARGRCLNRHDPKRRAKVLALARSKEREANARRDFLHKLSNRIVRENDGIAMEALRLVNMTRSAKGTVEEPGTNVAAKSGLNRSLLDTGFGILRQLIIEKAAWAARLIAVVDPKYTSQTCFSCKHRAAENRERMRFVCVRCGHQGHADINAARNILVKAELQPQSVLASDATIRLTQHDAA